jgi:hypothetical protein
VRFGICWLLERAGDVFETQLLAPFDPEALGVVAHYGFCVTELVEELELSRRLRKPLALFPDDIPGVLVFAGSDVAGMA